MVKKYLIWLTVVWGVYVALTLLAPASEATGRYGLTYVQLNIVRISYLVPNLLIWLTAGSAVARLYKYSGLVADSPEGKCFRQIAEGLLLLLVALIIPPFISLIAAFDPGDQNALKLVTIFRNYISIILNFSAYWLLWQGSKNLNISLNIPEALKTRAKQFVYLFIVVLGIAYIYTIFQNEFRTVSTDRLVRPTYFLPDWLILTTIVLPYIMIWSWGLLSIVYFREFSKAVTGTVYKKAFSNSAYGLIAIITLSISIQFLTQMAETLGHASIRVILVIIYVIYLVMAIGYYFIARGVRALTAIEEY